MSRLIRGDPQHTTRGAVEPTIAELNRGRLILEPGSWNSSPGWCSARHFPTSGEILLSKALGFAKAPVSRKRGHRLSSLMAVVVPTRCLLGRPWAARPRFPAW